jgi:iron complex transport system ATP-binding protein
MNTAQEGVSPAAGIIARDISLSYNGRLVLGSISLQLKKGSVITLLGPNGCGKTTLLKVINGLLRPDRGKVYVDGRDAAAIKQNDMARLIGYVPQTQRSSFPFTAMDIVLTGRMPHISALAQPGPRDVEKARQALENVGALHLASRAYTQISGGERQLVMVARALAQEPSYLLLDEPTSYLDFKNQFSVLNMISRIAGEQKVTAVMTLHDPNHALMFSDEVVLMRKLRFGEGGGVGDGNCSRKASLSRQIQQSIIAAGGAHEVMTPENIREAYGIEVEVLSIRGRRMIFPLQKGNGKDQAESSLYPSS